MAWRWRLVILVALAAALGGGAYVLGRREEPGRVRATLSVARALGGEPTAGFARALASRPFVFPADHGPHPSFRTEWWYYTGNLETAEARHFGFQLTFFRIALTTPRPVARGSAWGATQVYLAHFAVTDVAGRRFHAFERVSRDALGLAGATAAPFRVWLEDWSVEARGPAALPVRLVAAQESVGIDLTLDSVKPVVLQGDRGLSPKSAAPGNASYYYSLTRMPTWGTIRLGGASFRVRGIAWMDREWSTSALGPDQVGWDWFGLQLDDGREVMVYRLRRTDGGVDAASRGILVGGGGATRALAIEAVAIDVLGYWASPRDGARYPFRWRLRVPTAGLDLEITPHVADQELDLAVRYWEGAVSVRGTADGKAVAGDGYVELTGYAGIGGRAHGGEAGVRQ